MTISDVLTVLRKIAPENLAERWDRVGLHVGDEAARLRKPRGGKKPRAMLCIDLTEPVMAEAAERRAGLIVAYHPPIFHPLTHLTARDWKQRVLMEAVRRNIAVYSPHTALDAAEHGVCDWLCASIFDSAGNWEPITPVTPARDEYKVVAFVPEQNEVAVREAMSAAGAGHIGRYAECSFSASGTGGFRPLKGANPAIGKVGRREEVAERRLEMIVPGPNLLGVLAALRDTHPYEEPAYDVFRLEPEPVPGWQAVGAGRLVTLTNAMSARRVAEMVREALNVPLTVGGGRRPAIRTVAVCPGAGGLLFEQADADAYLTGEMRHHQALDLVQRGKMVMLAGHTETERPFLPVYRERIIDKLGGGVDWLISKADRPPLTIA